MERGETQGEMCPMAHRWALEALDQLCPTSVDNMSLIHSFAWSLSDKGVLSDCVVCKSMVIVSLAQNQRNSPQKNPLLTMIGMVLALERICLTKRYLSYSGFITCRSFLVT